MHAPRTLRSLGLVAATLASLAACSAGSSAVVVEETTTTVDETARTTAPEPSVAVEDGAATGAEDEGDDGNVNESLRLTVGSEVLTVTLADNSSVDALTALLADGPLTIDMRDYGNMEKVGPLGTNLPTNDEQITTEPGDVILYQGNALVIYYAPNSWSFTRIGKVDGLTAQELKRVLGSGSVSVTLSLD